MKKILSLLMLLMPLFLAAQNQQTKYVVKGQAVDSISHETLPYVTCSVVSEKKSAAGNQSLCKRFGRKIQWRN